MAQSPKYRDEKLPITAEVGGEGGSFADATFQESARRGVRSPGLPREEPTGIGVADVGGEAINGDEIGSGGVGTSPEPAEGMKKYPTE